MELPALPVLVQRVLQALAVLVQLALRVQELQAQQELAPQELRAPPAYKALLVLALTVQRGQPAQELQELLAPLEQRVLQALTVLPVPLVSLVYLVRRVPLALALRVQPVLQVLQGRPAPPGLSASLEPLGPQVQEPLEPRDHKDFLLASLTTKQKQRQQVVTQVMEILFGIMPHKLMQHNYWLAT